MTNRFTSYSCGTSISDESIISHSRPNALVIFILDAQPFGIDIDLVHSLTQTDTYTPVRDIHPGLSGFFYWTSEQGAGSVIPMLNIAHLLKKNESHSAEMVMMCNLNHYILAFKVDRIADIYDLTSHDLSSAGLQNSIPDLRFNGLEVLLPDFESLTSGVIQELHQRQKAARQQKHIFLVHHSDLLREALPIALHTAGYTKMTSLDDYGKAYPYLLEKYTVGSLPDLLIMGSTGHPPLSDLQSLIHTIKADRRFRSLPTILLTDRYDLPQYPEINAQISPFNIPGLIEQSDALTGTFTIPALANPIK